MRQAIVTFSILEGPVIRVEVGWPVWMIISTWFEKRHKKSPVFMEVASLTALDNRGVKQIGFNALFNILS